MTRKPKRAKRISYETSNGSGIIWRALGRAGTALFVGSLAIVMLVPILTIIVVSVGPGPSFDFVPRGISFVWYERALGNERFVSSLVNSTIVAVVSVSVAVTLVVPFAVSTWGRETRAAAAVQYLVLSPLFIPGVTVGISLFILMVSLGIVSGWTRLIFSHVVLVVPFCLRAVLGSISRLDPLLLDAARTLGASETRILFRVVIPNIMPGILAAALFGFLISFDNVPVSIFMADARTSTFPVTILSYLEFNFDLSVPAIAVIWIVITLTVVLFLDRLVGLRNTQGGQVG